MSSVKSSEIMMEELRSGVSLTTTLVDDNQPAKKQASSPLPPKPAQMDDFDEPFTFTWSDFYRRKFYISGAWDLEYYYTIRGCENFHIYLWIAKDMAWAQDWYWPAMIFGIAALLWCLVLAYHAIESGIVEEMYVLIGLIMWLSGNFVWMSGEVFKGDDDYVVPKTAIIMESAIAWLLFLHVVLKPLKLIPPSNYDESAYCRPGLVPRFRYFEYWRQYEHAHTICWLGKDLSWNQLNPYFWCICFIPTFFIAADFIFISFRTKRMMEDCVHYIAQLLWVAGNMLWAIGNVFVNTADDADDAPYYLFDISEAARARLRYFASWMLFVAYWPLIVLYLVWIPMTFMNVFDDRASTIHYREQGAYLARKTEMIARQTLASTSPHSTISSTTSPLSKV